MRLPLTRKNLDNLQKKCQKLESLFKILHPDLDLKGLLESGIDPTDLEPIADSTVQGDGSTEDEMKPFNDIDPENEELVPSHLLNHILEWRESVMESGHCKSFDGTAITDTTLHESGYLGDSAGVSLLRMVQNLVDEDQSGNSSNDHLIRCDPVAMKYSSSSTYASILQNENALISSVVTDALVDLYFRVYHPSFPLLHEHTFRLQYRNPDLIQDKASWKLLLRMVLAVGAFAGSTRVNNDDFEFYLSARVRLSAELFESGTIEQVQMLLLMANYLQKRDKPNTSYNILGLAVRMAIGMGLHRERQNLTGMPMLVRTEACRRLWWILYMFESGASLTFGRPSSMSDSMVNAHIPLNIDDSGLSPNDQVPAATSRVTPYTACIAQAKLAIIANRLYNSFFALRRPVSSKEALKELVCSFEEQLSKWRLSLSSEFMSENCPDWFKGPRAVVLWKEQNLRMLMYKSTLKYVARRNSSLGRRPIGSPEILRESNMEDNSDLKRCIDVACETVLAVDSYCVETYQIYLGIAWYATYFLFQAVLILFYAVIGSGGAEPWLARCKTTLDIGKRRLKEFENINDIARRYLEVLDAVEKRYQEQRCRRSESAEVFPNLLFSDNQMPLDMQGEETLEIPRISKYDAPLGVNFPDQASVVEFVDFQVEEDSVKITDGESSSHSLDGTQATTSTNTTNPWQEFQSIYEDNGLSSNVIFGENMEGFYF
ncbi:fungal-specific transcription factor domain-containing protein [Lipomyces oligophaga]|uniref:fungal-specific transcription factor domain-containing protein n=1 Tax=Lipomyces oligophaga TaxID=45792 RepID=UPI0034CE166A